MNEVKRLMKKSYTILRSGGIIKFYEEARHYVFSVVRKMGGGFLFHNKKSADVLFITCSLDGIDYAPVRYRVFFQKEQLESQGVSVDVIYYEDMNVEHVDRYDVFIFHRVPFLKELGLCTEKIKQQNKMCIYDIDDLIFEKELVMGKYEVKEMSDIERERYFDGIERNLKLLQLCDFGMASTETIATHMRKYIDHVFVQRNGFSEELLQYSQQVSARKQESKNEIIVGYFSGSATHDDDLKMIAQPLARILRKYSHVRLLIGGSITIPKALQKYSLQIKRQKFVPWKKLPEIIATVDINIVPLTDTVFNNAKSEIKYTEAALVKVPTVASGSDSFVHAIAHGQTGFIAKTQKEWFDYMEQLICDAVLRKKVGMHAFKDVVATYGVVEQGKRLMTFLEGNRAKKIVYLIPTTNISGGVMVVAQHALRLQKRHHNVLLVSCGHSKELSWIDDFYVPIITYETFLKNTKNRFLDIAVATLWSTVEYVTHSRAREKFYFVQNREYDFYKKDHPFYKKAKETYDNEDVTFFTMSTWCQDWLWTLFKKRAHYVPNGIDTKIFCAHGESIAKKVDGKTRILIEGNPDDHYKNVDESFEIIDQLDLNQYEIWFISYGGKPKKWYKYDRFFHGVPYRDMPKYYRSCDILLKTSRLESFSYPPLEMMACGGVCVVAENEGNKAFVKNAYNALSYHLGDIQTAVEHINNVANNNQLKEALIENGSQTAKEWQWGKSIDKLEALFHV